MSKSGKVKCPPGKRPVPVGGRIVCVDPKAVRDGVRDRLKPIAKPILDNIRRQLIVHTLVKYAIYAGAAWLAWTVYQEIDK